MVVFAVTFEFKISFILNLTLWVSKILFKLMLLLSF